jgi:hypothetical protein
VDTEQIPTDRVGHHMWVSKGHAVVVLPLFVCLPACLPWEPGTQLTFSVCLPACAASEPDTKLTREHDPWPSCLCSLCPFCVAATPAGLPRRLPDAQGH